MSMESSTQGDRKRDFTLKQKELEMGAGLERSPGLLSHSGEVGEEGIQPGMRQAST